MEGQDTAKIEVEAKIEATGIDDELDTDSVTRKRTLSEKGKSFELGKIDDAFRSLENITESTLTVLSSHASYEVVKSKLSLWMDKFENYMERHQNLMARLNDSDKEEYILSFEDRDSYLQNFKRTIENYLMTKKPKIGSTYSSSSGRRSHTSKHSDRGTENSRHSSMLSKISSKRLMEEQRKAELETQQRALKKKREIELAKIQLKMDEEEFKISTDIAVTDAKTKVLEKYEKIEQYKSETNSFATASSHSHSERKNKISDETFVVQLNPKAQVFEPKTTISENYRNNESVDSGLFYNSQLRTDNETKKYVSTDDHKESGKKLDQTLVKHFSAPDQIHVQGLVFKSQDYNNNINSDAVTAIVKNLRKPTPEIKKFGGDPLEFRKFVRQFTAKIVVNSDTEDEKMNYLEQFTYGEAHKVVSGFSHLKGDYAYQAAMKQLEERYGDCEVIANAFIKKAIDWPTIKAGDSKALDQFSLFLIECENAAHSIEALRLLEYSENIKRLMCKLPFHLHDRWRSIVLRTKTNKETVRFRHFVKFIEDESRKVNDLTYGSSAMGTKSKTEPNKVFNQRRNVRPGNNACATELNQRSTMPTVYECSYCKSKSHKLENCTAVLKLEHEGRYNHLKSNALCFGCLKKGHMTRNCRNRLKYTVCNKRHPTILHNEAKIENKQYNETNNLNGNQPSVQGSTSDVASQVGGSDLISSCTMAIVPVKVKLKNKPKTIDTFAFLDTGSSVSFCTEEVMRQLGGSGRRKEVTLNTMGSPHKMNTYLLDGIQICDIDMNSVIDLPTVYTKDEMPVSKSHIPTNEDISKWSHLNRIELPDITGTIGLMIGNNVPDAYTPFEIATGPKGSPHATRSRLGWIIWNLIRNNSEPETYSVVNRAQLTAIRDVQENSKLDNLVRKSINLDFLELLIDDKKENSIDDNFFLEQVNGSVRFENGHYAIALPFRNKDIKLPNNASQGLQRLKGLKSKMIKNPKFKDDYVGFMNNLLAKGYAEQVPENELSLDNGRIWYIPHHGVYHPKKPNKIRVVFDCTASYLGISLNGQLLQGPDLTNNLLGVLLRFRSKNVVLLGDIESMFHQVKVPSTDRNFLRFLWWPNGNLDSKPEVYRMTVHLFGATSSPSVCNFALKRTAQEYGEQFDGETVETINKNMYVDDCLTSTATDFEAVTIVKNVKSLCEKGGFNMTKWVSTSSTVLNSIPEKDRAKEVKQWDFDNECSVERALGVFWFIDNDTFGFQINAKEQPFTKRGILSVVSSVYDPLGIASPFVLLGRSILQNLCKQGVEWDEEIGESVKKKWINWLNQLNDLHSVKIDRCYRPQHFGNVVSSQIHCFSDASDLGLGMVFYLRLIDDSGRIHVSFVLGKSRVAPLKTITVPRMELTAAARTVRLSKVILEELNQRVDKVFYWTDSMTVLRYIFNRSTRFHTFVANRLALIHEATENEQWNYINTRQNPADFASRGMTVAKFHQSPQWLRGPDFLWLPEAEWPEPNNLDMLNIQENDSEVKQVVNEAQIENENDACHGINKLIAFYSNYDKLKRSVSWIVRVMKNLQRIVKTKHELSDESHQTLTKLHVLDIHDGEIALIRFVQHQQFEDEFKKLDLKSSVKRSSKLFKLDPFVDESGILRVGGRLERSDLSNEVKHPIILPKDSHVSYLIIHDIHKTIGHLGKNAILARLREKYWIIGASSIIKSIVSKCVTCRKYQAPIIQQKMADLPSDTVTRDTAPFTVVGMDYFGPFEIKQRRSTVKRYGVIFTCMKIRAVHLEMANSLDTDSCINAIRRFISRRGVPEMIRSDNGTNLVGAEHELKREIDKWNHNQLDNFMLQKNINWEFNPPAALNFGGAWERLIRLVRKVLYSILHEQNIHLDDENLHTLFCEVEAILNGRPVTDVSNNVNDLKVLTPNDLLLLRNGEGLPPGIFVKTDNHVKRRWRQVQYLADFFWNRWTKEYLPMLQERSKWNSKQKNLEIGDLVLVVDNTPRNSWTIGRVIEVSMGKHGVVRIAMIKTPTTVLKRSVGKLCLILENDTDNKS